MKPLKLRTKLTLLYAAVFSVLLAAAGVLFYNILSYQMDRSLRDELIERAAALRGYLRFPKDQVTLVYDASDPEEAFFVGNATRFYQIYNALDGTLVTRSDQLRALEFQYTRDEVRNLAGGPEFTQVDTDQVGILFHNDLVESPDGRLYLVQVGSALNLREDALRRFLRTMLWLFPSGIIVTLVSAWWISGRALKPVESLSAAARQVSISRLNSRVPLRGTGDELDVLAETFNEMIGRMEKAVGQMKDFNASISHELRTPLTALRGEAEIVLARRGTEDDYRHVLESQLEEFDKLSKMIDHMLTLARAEAGQIALARRGSTCRIWYDRPSSRWSLWPRTRASPYSLRS